MSQKGKLKTNNAGVKPETKQREDVRKEQLEILAEITAQRIVEHIKAGSL